MVDLELHVFPPEAASSVTSEAKRPIQPAAVAMARLALVGIVTKVGVMAKTSTVTVTRYIDHPVTRKRITRSKKYLTHDPDQICQLEDRVMIRHCNPVSTRKNFVLEKILNSARSPSTTPPTAGVASEAIKDAAGERLQSS